MGDFLIRVVVRILNKFWGPEPKLTPRSLYIARTKRHYNSNDDYATKARLSYGDDQY